MKDEIIEKIVNLILSADEGLQKDLVDLVVFARENLESMKAQKIPREQMIQRIITAFYETRDMV